MAGITTQALMAAYKAETRLTRNAIAASLTGGLKAAVYAGVLAFFARSAHGASREQITLLILGRDKVKESDGGEAKVYRSAMRLAGIWSLKGPFEGMAGANSFEAATKAALEYLAAKGVKSIESLGPFLISGETQEKDAPTFAAKVIAALKATMKVDAKKPLTEADLIAAAAAIVGTVGMAKAEKFIAAAELKLAELTVAEGLANAEAAPAFLDEPSETELYQKVA